jgi:hypothetical protein
VRIERAIKALTADQPAELVAVACMSLAVSLGAQRSNVSLAVAYERLAEYCRLCAAQERAEERN